MRLCGILAIGGLTPSDLFFEGGRTYGLEPALSSGYPAPLATPSPPDTAQMEAIPAERLFPFWRRYTDAFAPGEARFELAYRLDSELALETRSAGLWLQAAPGDLLPIGMDAAGYLLLPDAARERGIVTRQTRIFVEDRLAPPVVRLEIHPRLPRVQTYDIAELSEMAAQVERFQRDSMGLLFLASPRWTDLVFRFGYPAPDGWLVRPNGERVALAAAGNTLSIRLDGRTMRRGGQIELGAPPAQIILQAR